MNTLVLVIPAIFLPPLAMCLKTKSGQDTVINRVLCFLFCIPGVLHALWKVLTQAVDGSVVLNGVAPPPVDLNVTHRRHRAGRARRIDSVTPPW